LALRALSSKIYSASPTLKAIPDSFILIEVVPNFKKIPSLPTSTPLIKFEPTFEVSFTLKLILSSDNKAFVLPLLCIICVTPLESSK
jgi:hypothetical protein